MMRKWIGGLGLLGVILLGAGCTMCCHPYDYCGPVYQEGCGGKPYCPPCRCGSILDGCGWQMCGSCQAKASGAPASSPQPTPTPAPRAAEVMEPVPEPMNEQYSTETESRFSEGDNYPYTEQAEARGAAEAAEEPMEGPSLWIALPDKVQRR